MLNTRFLYAEQPDNKKRSVYTILNLVAVTFLSIILSSLNSFAQVSDVGKIIKWEKVQNGIKGTTENATFRVLVYNQGIVRVTLTRQEKFEEFSYILDDNAIPEKTDITIEDSNDELLIKTAMIDVHIEKNPLFRVTFKNKQGKIINEDVPGRGFSTGFIGNRSTIYKKMQPGERFIGLGEVLGNLDKRGSGYTLNNTDTYRYGDPRLPMYVSVPFYIGIHEQEVYGLFSHNSYKSFFNFGLSTPGYTSITLEGGVVDYFFIYDKSIGGILKNYTWLTGRINLPPLWSLGYHQSRCSYFPQANVELLAETFRKKNLPVDCIVLDADYLYHYQPFRINTNRFPDMKGLTAKLSDLGIEVTASVNPGIMIDSSYDAYMDGLKRDIFVKYADGSLYTADIAPNTNHFPDFTNQKAREWWAEKMKFLPENGIHGYWNDMNEPAVGGSYIPDNLIFNFEGRKANGLEAKNLFGMLMARSSYEAAIQNNGNRRPFILTRSGYAGVQRYAAIWTGDNTAKDEYLLGGTLLNTQMGLSGIPFVGDDIGGYIGTTTKELFIRWMQVGMFQPFCRNHKEAYSNANEPWSYGEESEGISRAYMEFRYRLLPYLYSAFYEATQTGLPIARSLAIENPFDDKIYQSPYQYQFMCGRDIMVVPVTTQEKVKSVYLPQGDWYDIFTDEIIKGNTELKVEVPIHKIPLFAKASAIIPLQTPVLNTKQKAGDTVYLHIYRGNEVNSFKWYEDDGLTRDYLKGVYSKRDIIFDPSSRTIEVTASKGNYNSSFRYIKFIMHGFNEVNIQFTKNSQALNQRSESIVLIDGLKYLNDLYVQKYYESLKAEEKRLNVLTFTLQNTRDDIVIHW